VKNFRVELEAKVFITASLILCVAKLCLFPLIHFADNEEVLRNPKLKPAESHASSA
jgi:hypothetical protein